MATPNPCPRHPRVLLVTFCPACRGEAGGRAVSEAAKRAAQRNLILARAKRAEREETR